MGGAWQICRTLNPKKRATEDGTREGAKVESVVGLVCKG